MLTPILEKTAADSGVKLIKVDIDESSELASLHEIVSVPTVKVFKGGKQVAGFVGVKDSAFIKRLLEENKS